jgi:hypothetical protein
LPSAEQILDYLHRSEHLDKACINVTSTMQHPRHRNTFLVFGTNEPDLTVVLQHLPYSPLTMRYLIDTSCGIARLNGTGRMVNTLQELSPRGLPLGIVFLVEL